MRRWDNLVDGFLKEYSVRDISIGQVRNRERELAKFGIWLKRKKPTPKIEDISLDLIHEYIKSRTTFLSKTSVVGVIGALRAMGDYLVENGVWLQNPLRWVTGPKINNLRKIPKNYHRSDLQKIFEQSFYAQIPHFRALYPAIISLFYSTGIRKSELLNLDVASWDSEEATIKVFASKTRRERVIPVPDVTRKCIENYLIKRNNLLLSRKKNSTALFINRNCERVNGTQLLVQFKRIAKRAGVDKATIHMFRHSCATGLIEEGVPLPQVQRILGHASTASTFRYLEIASPERKKAMNKHPINEILKSLKETEYERA